MSKLLDLPQGTYRCIKVKAKDNKAWMEVVEGQTIIGTYQPTIIVGERFLAQGRGFSDFINTSIVKDFTLLSQGKVEIETENSYYLLEEVTNTRTKPLT